MGAQSTDEPTTDASSLMAKGARVKRKPNHELDKACVCRSPVAVPGFLLASLSILLYLQLHTANTSSFFLAQGLAEKLHAERSDRQAWPDNNMVLADLGNRLHGALNQLSRASVVDEKVRRQGRTQI